MRAAVVTRAYDAQTKTPGKIECLEWDTPVIKAADDVLIHIAYASICGSDKHFITDNLFKDPIPFVAGHEWSGVIEDLGEEAKAAGFAVGDRVTGNFLLECGHCENCRTGKPQFCSSPDVRMGTQAEYTVFSYKSIYKLPDDVELDVAALTEPFSIALNAIVKADINIGDSVFIIGAGSVGQMLVQLAQLAGASVVATSARTASKRELALEMGADYAIDPTACDLAQECAQITNGKGFDIVFEASGNIACVTDALDIVGNGGKVFLVSYYQPEQSVPVFVFPQIVAREVSIKGLQMGQSGWPQAIKMLSKVNLRPIITKIYDLDDVTDAYEDLVKGKQLKILLRCTK